MAYVLALITHRDVIVVDIARPQVRLFRDLWSGIPMAVRQLVERYQIELSAQSNPHRPVVIFYSGGRHFEPTPNAPNFERAQALVSCHGARILRTDVLEQYAAEVNGRAVDGICLTGQWEATLDHAVARLVERHRPQDADDDQEMGDPAHASGGWDTGSGESDGMDVDV